MWKKISIALALAMVIASISAIPVAIAWPGAGRHNDILVLTHREKRIAWRDLHRQAVRYYGMPGLETLDRWVLPPRVLIKPVTSRAARDIPALAGYDFTIVEGMLLIVNPSDHAVAEVIGPRQHFG
jgi:hypothetical protein